VKLLLTKARLLTLTGTGISKKRTIFRKIDLGTFGNHYCIDRFEKVGRIDDSRRIG
jgi:hypothetical protein